MIKFFFSISKLTFRPVSALTEREEEMFADFSGLDEHVIIHSVNILHS